MIIRLGTFGLDFIGAPRNNKRRKQGGGTAVIFRNDIFTGARIVLNPPTNCEICAVLLTPTEPGQLRGYIVLALYLPPNITKKDTEKSIDFLSDSLQNLAKKYAPTAYEFSVSGDFNRVCPKTIGRCMPGGLTNMSVHATRKRSHLDHFLTNFPEHYQLGEIAPPLGFGSEKVSDHKIVFVKSRNLGEKSNLRKL